MEIELAKILEEMSIDELIEILTKLKMTNNDGFSDLKEIVDDL
jgi:Mg/Co/Ni transporter MgtE